VRLDRCPVLSYLDDDGVTRLARVLAERDGRVCVMVTRDVGMTHLRWRPAASPGPSALRRSSAPADSPTQSKANQVG
jgi:hypothetical protein